MGKTFSTGLLTNGIWQDSSNNIGIGAAPSGTYKFEVTGTAKISGVATFGSTLSNGTYSYTLPSATGTLALTSDLSSYVPYTGATATVNIGTNSFLSKDISIEGNGTYGGGINIKQYASSILSGAGYTALFATTGTLGILFGAGNSAIISGASLSANRTFTLPDASGTLALTSSLSGYLPLTGGTLTGALGGTSATFSSSVTANNYVVSTGNNTTIFNSASATTGWQQIAMNNTSGSTLLGVEGSTAGTLATGTTAYATLLRNYTSTDLQLATNNIVRATITSAGNVAIGTTSPSCLLHLQKAGGTGSILQRIQNETVDGYSGTHLYGSDNAIKGHFGWANASAGTLADKMYFGTIAAKDVVFTTSDTERMRITSGGNVGIGTSSPATRLDVVSSDLNNIFVTNPDTSGATTGSGIGFKAYNGSSVAQAAGIILTSNTWSFGTYSANQLSLGSDGTGGLALRTANSAPITFFTGGATAGVSTERMRITSGGTLNYNIASNTDVADQYHPGISFSLANGGTLYQATNTTASVIITRFANPNGNVGSITTSGVSTSYNPSSDRRLKENIKSIENAIEKVLKLKPVSYTWIKTGESDDGFIAQDLLEIDYFKHRVNPIGEAEDGTDLYGVDYMRFVSILTAAIQEQQKQIEELKQLIK